VQKWQKKINETKKLVVFAQIVVFGLTGVVHINN